jgi:hypothetical protein
MMLPKTILDHPFSAILISPENGMMRCARCGTEGVHSEWEASKPPIVSGNE